MEHTPGTPPSSSDTWGELRSSLLYFLLSYYSEHPWEVDFCAEHNAGSVCAHLGNGSLRQHGAPDRAVCSHCRRKDFTTDTSAKAGQLRGFLSAASNGQTGSGRKWIRLHSGTFPPKAQARCVCWNLPRVHKHL